MSTRNRPQAKKIRALRRALRKGRLPAHINLIEWLKDRGHAQTTGEAVDLIMAGWVMSESHVLGVKTIDGERVLDPIIPASLRSTIMVVA